MPRVFSKARGFWRLVHVKMSALLSGRLVRPHYSTADLQSMLRSHVHTHTLFFLAANVTITPVQRHTSHLPAMSTECPISLSKGCAPKTSRLRLYDITSKWQLRTRVSVACAMHPAMHPAMRLHRCTRINIDKPADIDTCPFAIIL